MKIYKIALGNAEEAYIEDRICDGLNIIFSNDNNKGKTLLIQGAMYALGYDGIFPAGFDYRDYYFYVEIELNNKRYEFLRKYNSVIVKQEEQIDIFNSISELKHFFNSNIRNLPKVEKDGFSRLSDLSMLYEIFFLGQDKRNPSNLIIKGANNKKDFINMLYAMRGFNQDLEEKYDENDVKEKKKELENQIKEAKKKLTFIKNNPKLAEQASKSRNFEKFQNSKKKITEISNRISDLNKQIFREFNRVQKLRDLMNELNSLNRQLDVGKVACANCGSDKIIFTNNDFEFEISNYEVKNKILSSIKSNIEIKNETIEELQRNIKTEQNQLQKEIAQSPVDSGDLLLYRDIIIENVDLDGKIQNLQEELIEIQAQIEGRKFKTQVDIEKKKAFMESLIERMNTYYKKIDKNGTMLIEDIFTKNNSTHSGSDEQEFYFCKLLALNDILKHDYPIIIDFFRGGELSTRKENAMLDIFSSLNKQVIVTSTLKQEEYMAEKYYSIDDANVLDFSNFSDSKLLQNTMKDDFRSLLDNFDGFIMQKI